MHVHEGWGRKGQDRVCAHEQQGRGEAQETWARAAFIGACSGAQYVRGQGLPSGEVVGVLHHARAPGQLWTAQVRAPSVCIPSGLRPFMN